MWKKPTTGSLRIDGGKILRAIYSSAATLSDFSRRAHVPYRTLSQIFRVKRARLSTLEKICAGLTGYKPEDFIKEENHGEEGCV